MSLSVSERERESAVSFQTELQEETSEQPSPTERKLEQLFDREKPGVRDPELHMVSSPDLSIH